MLQQGALKFQRIIQLSDDNYSFSCHFRPLFFSSASEERRSNEFILSKTQKLEKLNLDINFV